MYYKVTGTMSVIRNGDRATFSVSETVLARDEEEAQYRVEVKHNFEYRDDWTDGPYVRELGEDVAMQALGVKPLFEL